MAIIGRGWVCMDAISCCRPSSIDGTLDLLMTDVPDLVRAAQVTQITPLSSVGGYFDDTGCSRLVC